LSARSRLVPLLSGAGTLALAGLAALAARGVAEDLERERDLHVVEHVTSGECRRCHSSHYESWSRTFHRTMTQEASEAAVLGDFGGATHVYGGITAHMDRDEDGFVMTFMGPEGPLGRAQVERTVGSPPVQKYLPRHDNVTVR